MAYRFNFDKFWQDFRNKSNRYNRQQSLLYSIDIWPARSSRLTHRETNQYITRCASDLAWP